MLSIPFINIFSYFYRFSFSSKKLLSTLRLTLSVTLFFTLVWCLMFRNEWTQNVMLHIFWFYQIKFYCETYLKDYVIIKSTFLNLFVFQIQKWAQFSSSKRGNEMFGLHMKDQDNVFKLFQKFWLAFRNGYD